MSQILTPQFSQMGSDFTKHSKESELPQNDPQSRSLSDCGAFPGAIEGFHREGNLHGLDLHGVRRLSLGLCIVFVALSCVP